jgi:predicted Zn-ribbon and HTH transcriptional regulator
MANYAEPKVVHLRCKICNYVQLHAGHGIDLPTECPRCHTEYQGGATLVQVPSSGVPRTHNMVRWSCRWCRSYGVVWLDKKIGRMNECPSCGHDNGGGVRVQKIDPKGSCSTIWTPVEGITRSRIRINLPKKKYRCPDCHQTHHYLMKKPDHCHRCGRQFEDDDGTPHQAVAT